ncbi:MAG: hypothetical protein M5R38_13270 [Candidatus Methylomirabilis sp.]|nr:hypothetical protein [Candidatus Methylomirabilis sp.]
MAIDPTKPKRVLVIHGVQSGTDADQNQHQLVKEPIKNRLNNAPLRFETEMYRYENINDEAQRQLRQLLKLFLTNIIAEKVVDLTADTVLDVLIALKGDTTAQKIRQGLVDRLLEIHEEGNPLYLVAHSLGTIYAFDAVNQLIGTPGLFERDNRKSWPALGLITLGSPIGLRMFKARPSETTWARQHQVSPLDQLLGSHRPCREWFILWKTL